MGLNGHTTCRVDLLAQLSIQVEPAQVMVLFVNGRCTGTAFPAETSIPRGSSYPTFKELGLKDQIHMCIFTYIYIYLYIHINMYVYVYVCMVSGT